MRVLFYPELPDREGYTIVSICHELGYQGVATLDEAFDLAFTWQDRAWLDPQPVLEAIAARVPVWNLWCRDVGRRRVEAAARAVMGYGLEVDPTVYAGPCAMRPVDGGRGFLVHAPVERPEGGYVYQRLVVCTQSGRPAHYRVSVVAGEIPVCYVLERAPMHEHLRTPVLACRIVAPDELFSRHEQALLLGVCAHLGPDSGEIPVLRDDGDGRLHVVDVDKTPGDMGLASRLRWTVAQRRFALGRLAEAFAAAVQAGRPHRRA